MLNKKAKKKVVKEYICSLINKTTDEVVDTTSIDENNKSLAEYLFFNEFGHSRKGMHVVIRPAFSFEMCLE